MIIPQKNKQERFVSRFLHRQVPVFMSNVITLTHANWVKTKTFSKVQAAQNSRDLSCRRGDGMTSYIVVVNLIFVL